jgi:protein-tyrosine phosphatase
LIDLHSHILPGIDDGARSLDIALQMAQQAVDGGVRHMVCTPHIHKGYFDNTLNTIRHAFNEFQNAIADASIPLSLSYAAEVRVNELIPIWFKQKELPFLGEYNGKHILLLEMPHSHIPQGLEVLIKWLLKNNVQPLIAHPERNRELLAEQHKFSWLQRQGCMFQVTAGALTGRFGDKVEDFALSMMRNKALHVVASDTHDLVRRPNDMQAAYEVVSTFSHDFAQETFVTRPGAIVSVGQRNEVTND